MDTGPYATAAGHPYGVVGPDDRQGQGLLESHRMADSTVGPWEIDAGLRSFPGPFELTMTGPIATTKMMADNNVLPPALTAIADAHGYFAGFSSFRIGPDQSSDKPRALQNVVLRFADPPSAAAAATEMAAANPGPTGAPGRPTPFSEHPEALVTTWDLPDDRVAVQSFAPHGPFVLVESAQTSTFAIDGGAETLTRSTLQQQKRRIDEFTPTPPDKLADLPLDPTGNLMAHTLWAPDLSGPIMAGAWTPRAWLHFEDNPLTAGPLFAQTGVKAVAQRLSTVYDAKDPDSAERLITTLADQASATGDIRPSDPVPGLPSARCFQRAGAEDDSTKVPETIERVEWRHKCFASTDHYAFTAYSADAADARQQISAQYRILAGE